jgi:hypothetical protein
VRPRVSAEDAKRLFDHRARLYSGRGDRNVTIWTTQNILRVQILNARFETPTAVIANCRVRKTQAYDIVLKLLWTDAVGTNGHEHGIVIPTHDHCRFAKGAKIAFRPVCP